MKIVHVNTHTYGGAAVVAKRIHYALLRENVDSTLLTKYGTSSTGIKSHVFLKDARLRYFIRRISLKSNALYPMAKFLLGLKRHPNLVNQPKGFEVFSPLNETLIKPSFSILERSDIIHLHHINDFIDDRFFFKQYAHKKFVWTLHDMNPITGGCHHSDGCLKFEQNCMHCPQLKSTVDENFSAEILNFKIESLKPLTNDQLIIVSPSKWLLELSKRSKITRRFRHEFIDNPSFGSFTFLKTKNEIKQELNLPLDKKIVLFVADNLRNVRKGIQLLFDSALQLKSSENILFVGIGNSTKFKNELPIVFTGSIDSPEVMAKYYSCADVFVISSIAENSPLVVIESLTCGTPVVGSAVGGITDLITVDNGLTFPVNDVKTLTDCIFRILFEKKMDQKAIENSAKFRFSPDKIGSIYIDLYKQLTQ